MRNVLRWSLKGENCIWCYDRCTLNVQRLIIIWYLNRLGNEYDYNIKLRTPHIFLRFLFSNHKNNNFFSNFNIWANTSKGKNAFQLNYLSPILRLSVESYAVKSTAQTRMHIQFADPKCNKYYIKWTMVK